MKDPTKAIESLDKLRGEINLRVSFLGYEMDDIADNWDRLGVAGGQRDDHAAMLLARLRAHLDDLSSFTATVSGQITGMVADPFQRKTEEAARMVS